MNGPRLYFPHFSRLFSASSLARAGTACLWLAAAGLISANATASMFTSSARSNEIIRMLTHPLSWEIHADAGQVLWREGQKTRAMQELLLARELYAPFSAAGNQEVLGAQTPPDQLLLSWKEEPLKEREQESYWLSMAEKYPDYRDAYIQLAQISYREGNLPQAHAYLLRAQLLDPNNETISRLVTFVASVKE